MVAASGRGGSCDRVAASGRGGSCDRVAASGWDGSWKGYFPTNKVLLLVCDS